MQPAAADRPTANLRRRPTDLLRGVVRRCPATLAFLVLFWALGAVFGTVASGPEPPLLDLAALSADSLPEHWPALILSPFWANGLAGYLGGTVLALLLGLPAEGVLGTRRFLAAAAGTQLAGAAAAIGLAGLFADFAQTWGRQLATESSVGPVAFLCGSAAAASAGLGALWRRRLRLVLFTLLTLLALYSGSFQDVMVLAAAVIGGLAGPLLFGRRPGLVRAPAASRRESRVLVALAVAACAVGPVIAALNFRAVGPLSVLGYLFTDIQAIDPMVLAELCADPQQGTACTEARLQLNAGPAGIFLATAPQVLLVVCAEGLRRGRRFAWWGAVLLQAGAVAGAGARLAAFLTGAGDQSLGPVASERPAALVLPMAVPLAVLVLLAATRRLFAVQAPAGTYRRLAIQAAGAWLLLAAAYWCGGLLLRTGFTPPATPGTLLADLPFRFLPALELRNYAPSIFPRDRAATVLYEGVGPLFWATVAALVLLSFLRPARSDQQLDRDRARELLKTYGGNTLAWMTLWPGNSYWFAPAGRAYVAYRTDVGVALTVGEPVGPAADIPDAVIGFAAFCADRGNAACFYSVGPAVRRLAADQGFSSLQVAEETVLDLAGLAFKGRRFQDVRTALNRARKEGIRAEWTRWEDAPLAILDQLRTISEEWVADKKMPEMGFTLGGLEEMKDPEVRCLLAVDQDRTVHGVTSWLPVYRDGKIIGWTLDFMRRRGTGFPAAMDFLIGSAALSLQEEGYELLSLSGAPLARAVSTPDSTPDGTPDSPDSAVPAAARPAPLDRVLDLVGATLEPVYGFRSLLAFKAKFQPRYVPRYLAYLDPLSLPAIANAVGRAYLPHLSVGQGLSLARRIVGTTR